MTPQDWQDVEPAPESLCLKSANGPVCASQMISYQCTTTGEVIDALVMKDSPPVISIGRRCMLHGWGFYWEPGEAPYIILPCGKTITCIVEGYVPYLEHRPSQPVVACVSQGVSTDQVGPVTQRQCVAPGCLRCPAPATPCGGDACGEDRIADGVAAPAAECVEVDVADDEPGGDDVPDQDEFKTGSNEDALSLEHLMTHSPKNAHCSACQRANMVKKHARTKRRTPSSCPPFSASRSRPTI